MNPTSRAAGENLPQPRRDAASTRLTERPEIERLISVYLRTLTSSRTVKTYNTEIQMFMAFLGEKLGIKELGKITAGRCIAVPGTRI